MVQGVVPYANKNFEKTLIERTLKTSLKLSLGLKKQPKPLLMLLRLLPKCKAIGRYEPKLHEDREAIQTPKMPYKPPRCHANPEMLVRNIPLSPLTLYNKC